MYTVAIGLNWQMARVEAVALHLKHQLWLLDDKSSIALTSLARCLFTPQETVNNKDKSKPLSLKELKNINLYVKIKNTK
jgi:hypothetical protein